jgi:hypothetical protein
MKPNLYLTSLFVVSTALVTPNAFAEKEYKPKKEEVKAKPYPLKTCIVSGDKLGEMGKPIVFVYQHREIKLCCKDCRKDFDLDPDKYLKKLESK